MPRKSNDKERKLLIFSEYIHSNDESFKIKKKEILFIRNFYFFWSEFEVYLVQKKKRYSSTILPENKQVRKIPNHVLH